MRCCDDDRFTSFELVGVRCAGAGLTVGKQRAVIDALRFAITVATVIGVGSITLCESEADDMAGVCVPFTGAYVTLPVCIDGQTYQFRMDTGASRSGVDESLRELIGDPVDEQNVVTPGGPKRMQLFKAPPATIAGRPLTGVTYVSCHKSRAWIPIAGGDRGTIGMDFLRTRRLRLDPDAGQLEFLESVGDQCGTPVPLFYFFGAPAVSVDLDGASSRVFVVDTGDKRLNSGFIEARFLSRLIDVGRASMSGAESTASFKSDGKLRNARISVTNFATFCHRGLVFTEAAVNSLGMGYLSRYIVTFDFPGNVMYLKPSRRFRDPSPTNLSGAELGRRSNGDVVVRSVDEKSAAFRCGLNAGDTIIAIDSYKCHDMEDVDVVLPLTRPGAHRLRLSRAGNIVNVTLVLVGGRMRAADAGENGRSN